MPDVLRLEVTEFTDLTRWRWRLADMASGVFLADHRVELAEADWQFEAFGDLLDHISWHVNDDAHDARIAHEAQIVAEIGDWAGEQVFGTAVMNALARRRNATVRVALPAGAEALAFLPLELARADGKTLAGLGITLVIETADPPAQPKEPVGERLRVLGLFSLPEESSPLNLRHERLDLVSLVRGIAASGRAADVKVLQYGVTRERLRDVLTEAEGWDIIHVSGHGAPGELLLETASGGPDRIHADDLADLLDLARDRVKLITIAACWSAARTADEQRRLLQLPIPEDHNHSSAERISATAPAPGALATELTARLACAVLAMRFPVDDEFAINLSAKLYPLLADKGQPLPRALALTLSDLSRGDSHGQAYPALSLAAPAVFGPTTTRLVLRAPDRAGPLSYATETLKMPGFPEQPGRFVGRTAVMARASAALAKESRLPGILLHGMPGGGKTACALELAYGHEDAFDRLVWFKAPDEDMDISGALTDFALALERDLLGFQMIHVLADERKLTAYLPQLTELLERSRLLIVIDNVESLLTETGQWRDQRWGAVVGALTAHTGLGRLILTSRRVSAETRRLHVEPVDALTVDEALLLARELPHLRALIHGDLPGIDCGTARKLALGVLTTAQGNPELIELADRQAGHPERLAELVQAGDQAWQEQGGLPDGFFTAGKTSAASDDYLQVLAAWTKSVADALSPGERDLFWFLCCLEEHDRARFVLQDNWASFWHRLGRCGDLPELGSAADALTVHGLAVTRKANGSGSASYAIHPAVAAAGRDNAGHAFQDAVDTQIAVYWSGVYQHARAGSEHTKLQVRAGLAAVPYLTRLSQWQDAAMLLHNAFICDQTRANAATFLPLIQRITHQDPRQRYVLAKIWGVLDPAAAEDQLRLSIDEATARRDYETASHATSQLIYCCRTSGRLEEALTLAEHQVDYARYLGAPWLEIFHQCRRLQVLNETGHANRVLSETRQLLNRASMLPDPRPDDDISAWQVRELLLETGRYAARQLRRWDYALELNAALIDSKRRRHASASDIAQARFSDATPLLRLGRIDDARVLLLDCLQTFQDLQDIEHLGRVLGSLANLEHQRGHEPAAVRLARDALRHSYVAGNTIAIAACYHNLGSYIYSSANVLQASSAVASHLAGGLICALTGIGDSGSIAQSTDGAVHDAALDLLVLGTAATPPDDVADLCHKLSNLPGDPAGLISKLSPAPEIAGQALRDLVIRTRATAHKFAQAVTGAGNIRDQARAIQSQSYLEAFDR